MPDGRVSRRRFLVGAALATSVAGCLGAPEVENSPGTPENEANSAPAQPPADVDARYSEIYQNTINSVAMVQSYGPAGLVGQGSGFAYRDDILLTNEHVVAQGGEVDLQFPGNNWAFGEVIGSDRFSDLAVIRADLPDSADPLLPAETRATVGQEVLALGNPFGLEESVSQGIVSGRNRSLPTGTGFRIPATIQTDAGVNPGNSGGPLINMRERFLGVITARAGQAIGFAVSWRLVERVAPSLIEDGSYDHSFMGIRSQPVTPSVAEANDLEEIKGVIVVETLPGGPSQDELRGSHDEEVVRGRRVPVGGDIIVQLDDAEVGSDESLTTYLALHTRPGDEIDVMVIRNGERITRTIELGRRPRI